MTRPIRALVCACAALTLIAVARPASAQGFGIGGRIAMVNSVDDVGDDTARFLGAHLRLTSPRTGIEVSFDRRTDTFDELDERVKETPIQVSLLLFLAGGGFKPYLLGGPGWYKRSVEPINAPELEVSNTKFGWHGGFGAEIRGGHFGVHGDYRYTFLNFGDDDDDDDEGLVGRFLPSHNGHMWTVGATFYF
jgi:hypothetical protein